MLPSKLKARSERRNYMKNNTFYSIKPLNSVLKLFGLSCLYLEGTELKYSRSFTKHIALSLFLAVLNGFNLYRKLGMSDGHFSFTFKDFIKIIFIFGYLQYILDVIYVLKYGRSICLKYYNTYEHIDRILNMNYYSIVRKKVIRITIIFTAVGVVSTIFDVAAWYVSCNSMFIGVNMIDYIYVLMRQYTVADTIAQVTQIEYRLKVFEDLLSKYYLSCDNVPGLVKDVVAERRLGIGNTTSIIYVQAVGQRDLIAMKLDSSYLLILEQTNYVNAMYGIRIMAVCLTILIDITILMNVAIRILVGNINIQFYFGVLPVFSSIFRIASCALVLLSAMYRCEQTYAQSENIIRLVYHLLHNKIISPETREMLKNLRDLMTARPVEFHAVNFYKLDYSLLLSITSVIVTYTIIFLQNLK